MNELEVIGLGLKDTFSIKPKEFHDERGTFYKLYIRDVFKARNLEPLFPESYLTISKKGAIRGLHYQLAPYAQAKLVKCIKGEIFDVIVDLRKSSNTFGKGLGISLSEKNKLALYVPRGFAHGFLSMTKDSIVSYMADNDYAPNHERGILWNDKQLGIDWPGMDRYIISEKDKRWPLFEKADKFE